MKFYTLLSRKFPGFKDKLKQAGMNDTVPHFFKKVITLSFLGSFALCFLFILPVVHSMGYGFIMPLSLFPFAFFSLVLYFSKLPDLYILKKIKEIDKELPFVVRFMLLEIDSGVLLDKSFRNISFNYDVVGKYFAEIIKKVDYGEDMESAISDVVNDCPNERLKSIFVQIQNSLMTGSDMYTSLHQVSDHIAREQKIIFDDYAKKLNPLAMFYMIIAVIFPSIGFMMIIIISSLIGFKVDLTVLSLIAGFVIFIQFMFLSMMKSMRPAVDFS